jgi:hypothetical protein
MEAAIVTEYLSIDFGAWVYRHFAPDIEAYCDILLNRIDPIFEGVDGEHERVAKEFLSSIAHHYGPDDDPSSAYEAAIEYANDHAYQFIEMRTVFLATGVSGLFHLFEKQLYRHANKELEGWLTNPISQWRDLEALFPKFMEKSGYGLCPDLNAAYADPDLQELSLVANAIKHGENGSSYRKLRERNAVVVSKSRLDADGTVGPYSIFNVNLSVQAKDVMRYRDAILRFWRLDGTFLAPRTAFK